MITLLQLAHVVVRSIPVKVAPLIGSENVTVNNIGHADTGSA